MINPIPCPMARKILSSIFFNLLVGMIEYHIDMPRLNVNCTVFIIHALETL